MKTPTVSSATSSRRGQISLRSPTPRLPRSSVCSMQDLANPSAFVHPKRFSTPSLTLKVPCAGNLNRRSYQMQWAMLAPQSVNVQIKGPCVSACTILLGYIPRERICVNSGASLGFDLATPAFVTEDLLRVYPLDIRLWIEQHGGLTHQIIWLQAPDIYGYFQRC
jgi:hypothetical protein